MKRTFSASNSVTAMAVLSLSLYALGAAPARAEVAPRPNVQKELVHMQAAGTFDVKLTPQMASPEMQATQIDRMAISKQFHGDLAAVSDGEMLALRTAVEGSAGYVAIERVTGELNGRKGSFMLQHSGTMNRGASSLVLTVIPDSGTDALTGLSGSMAIRNSDGKHTYTMEYTLP